MNRQTQNNGQKINAQKFMNNVTFINSENLVYTESKEAVLLDIFSSKWSIPMEQIWKLKEELDSGESYASSSYLASHKIVTILDDNTSAEWSAQLQIVNGEDRLKYISLYVWLMKLNGWKPEEEKTLNVTYKARIFDKLWKQKLFERVKRHRQFGLSEDQMIWGWPHFVLLDKLGKSQEHLNMSIILTIFRRIGDAASAAPATATPAQITTNPHPNVQLKLTTIDLDETAETSNHTTKIEPSEEFQQIQAQSKFYESYWRSIDSSDMIIECKDACFRAHSFVLGAHSEQFSEFLNEIPAENLKNGLVPRLNLSNVDCTLVEGLLEFCYTGTTELFQNFALCGKLCELGYNLQMNGTNGLTDQAFYNLTQPQMLKPWTLVFVLDLAKTVDMLNDPFCLTHVQEFISKNFFEIKEMNGFKKWMDDESNAQIFATILFS